MARISNGELKVATAQATEVCARLMCISNRELKEAVTELPPDEFFAASQIEN